MSDEPVLQGTWGEYIDPDDALPPTHPEADVFDPGCGDAISGTCICSEPLPPRRLWHDALTTWSWVVCMSCRTLYVDEDEFIAIYDEPRRNEEELTLLRPAADRMNAEPEIEVP